MLGLFKVCYLLFKKYLLSEISHAIFSLNIINEVKYRNFLKGSNSISLLFYSIGLIIFSPFFFLLLSKYAYSNVSGYSSDNGRIVDAFLLSSDEM